MKHLFLPILALCAATASVAQPAPAYVLFNASCMQQLEYQYTRTGAKVYAYSVQQNADEQYIFWSGSNSLPTSDLPVGTFDCNNLRLNDDVVKIINESPNTRHLYFIHQMPNKGYLMMPVYSVTQVKRYGPWYLLVSPKYTFAIDTTKLSYQDNLQGETSPAVIRFAGSQLANCRYQWRFHGEPARGFTEKMDFEFIYGIGLVSNRIGATTADLEQSEMRLTKVNGATLDSYLTGICPQSEVVNNNTTPAWTQPPYYGTSTDPDKEAYPSNTSPLNNNGYQNTTANNNTPNPYNCPVPPGRGYHVVQRGESLKAIARTYNVDLKSLITWNNIKDPDHIQVCQQIWLQKPPTAKSGAAVPATTPKKPAANGTTVQDQSIYWQANSGSGTGGGGNRTSAAPAQYSTKTVAPVQYSTEAQKRHVVQKGESVYSISKKYLCAEECIRRANNFAPSGHVALQIGQVLIIPDCSCTLPENAAPRTYSTSTAPPPEVSNILNKQNNTNPQVQPDVPAEYGFQNPASVSNQGGNTNPANPTATENPQDLPPTQEYIVRQGETLNSIAIKFKMSVAELSALNNLPQDEKLNAGRRLVVRKY
jgi:LysM repeat protein